MDFVTAVRYANLGYRIKRAHWDYYRYLSKDESLDGYHWIENVLSDDWEIITEGIIKEYPITYEDEVICDVV